MMMLFISCHSPRNITKVEPVLTTEEERVKGEEKIKKNDCLACHKMNEELVGPSFEQVAARYPVSEATIEKLSDKIIKGGQGSWGKIFMTPHPNLSPEEAKMILKYILSFKK